MIAANCLDGSAAAWLAQQDSALVHLPDALAATEPNWSLHDVQWTPDQGCRLAYRVEAEGTRGATFVALNLDPIGWTRHDFRDDPCLPGLLTSCDSPLVLDSLGTVEGEPILHCRVQPIRYRPGARCVLRYDVLTASGTARYFAKVFPRSVFADAARRATRVAAAAQPALRVTRVLAVWPDLQATVGAAVDGRSLSTAFRDATVSSPCRVDLAKRLGGLLADFHAVKGVPVPVRTTSEHLGAVADLLPAVSIMNAALGDRLRRLVHDLARHVPPHERLDALTHGGFRSGQVVVDEAGQLWLLDLDGVCLGDAAQDLGSALSHLSWQAIRQSTHRSRLRPIHQALLAGYQSRGHAVDPASLVWWRAAVLAQIAARRFRRLEVADWVLVPQLLDLAENLLHSPQANDTP
jgi:aminoglycoside phosphotransferase (APT) family kinase protein